jgi:hypothetical protein
MSSPFSTLSKVPQGSNLGLTLFNNFINSLSVKIKQSKLFLFADDLKMYRDIRCVEDFEAVVLIMSQLEHASVVWNQLTLLDVNRIENL